MSGDNLSQFREAILASIGYAPDTIEPRKLHRFHSGGRPADRSGWCCFDDTRGGAVGRFGDWRSGLKVEWRSKQDAPAIGSSVGADTARRFVADFHRRQAQAKDQVRRGAAARRNAATWGNCRPVTVGDPVDLYLRRRLAVPILRVPACIQLADGLAYWEDGRELGRFPTMVSALTGPDGELVALHRTYLTDDGRKADVPTVKKLTAASGPMAGASIRLCNPRAGVLGVAEGVETALAASMASGVPTVAAYCAGALEAFRWPSGLQRLVVFGDADDRGMRAADALRLRAETAGLRCSVLVPEVDGEDWCDAWSQSVLARLAVGGSA